MKTNELLRHYVDDRSESAFEELVRQHIDLVLLRTPAAGGNRRAAGSERFKTRMLRVRIDTGFTETEFNSLRFRASPVERKD